MCMYTYARAHTHTCTRTHTHRALLNVVLSKQTASLRKLEKNIHLQAALKLDRFQIQMHQYEETKVFKPWSSSRAGPKSADRIGSVPTLPWQHSSLAKGSLSKMWSKIEKESVPHLGKLKERKQLELLSMIHARHHRQAVPLHHLKPEEGTIYDKVLPSDRDSEGRGDECDQTPDTTVCLSEAALPWQSGTSTCFVGPF